MLRRFLDAYGEHMEFCQLQINWFDWEFQKAKEKYELVASRGIPVWVMEPLRGGKLASLGEDFLPRVRAGPLGESGGARARFPGRACGNCVRTRALRAGRSASCRVCPM